MQIHIARNGQPMGPFSLEEVNSKLAAGTLSLSDQAWYEGAAGWAPLSTVPGVSGSGVTSSVASPAPAAPSASVSSHPAAPAPGTAIAASSAPVAKTETLAVLSLIFSICGLLGFCCGLFLVLAIAGVVCGHLALAKFKTDPTLQGRGLAQAGVIIGYVAVAVWLGWIFLFGGLAALQAIFEGMSS